MVAAKDGTDKALAARKIPGCYLVKPAWLVECYWCVTHRDVKPHLMGQGVGEKPAEQPKKIDDSDSSDSDDDELAAELEKEMES